MPEYDCIIPWSGGVESTAAVYWAVKNNKSPLCIHNRMQPAEWESVQIMADILNIKVYKVQEVNNTPIDKENRDFYHKKFHYQNKTWNPVIHRWAYFCMEANLRWPLINKIYYGHCGAGCVEKGDGLGDLMHDSAIVTFNMFESFLKVNGVDSKFIAPLDHLTKREQWLSLPIELKKEIMTCQKYESNLSRSNCKMTSCNKCVSILRAVPNDELHLIR